MNEAFTFYASFYEAINELDDADRLAVYDAICSYGITGIVPELSGVAAMAFKLMRPNIDANLQRRSAGKTGGETKAKNSTAEASDKQTCSKRVANDKQTCSKRVANDKQASTNKDKDIDKDIDKDKEKPPAKAGVKKKETRHRHGEYGHVLLTDAEYTRLVNEFGDVSTANAIRKVDEYCQSHGRTYKDYNLVIRNWGFDNKPQAPPGNTAGYVRTEYVANDPPGFAEMWGVT